MTELITKSVPRGSSPDANNKAIASIKSDMETFLDTLTMENSRLEDEIEQIKLSNRTIFERFELFGQGLEHQTQEINKIATTTSKLPKYDVIGLDTTVYDDEAYDDSVSFTESVPRTINDRLAMLESQVKDVEWSVARYDTLNQTDELDMFMVTLDELSGKVDSMEYDNLQSTIEVNKQVDSLIARVISVTEGFSLAKNLLVLKFCFRHDPAHEQCHKCIHFFQSDVWFRVQRAQKPNEQGRTSLGLFQW